MSAGMGPYASQTGWMRAYLPCAAAVPVLASLVPQMRALTFFKAIACCWTTSCKPGLLQPIKEEAQPSQPSFQH